MRLEKIKDTYNNIIEVNLDSLGVILDTGCEIQLTFGGYYVNVNHTEWDRIRNLLEPKCVGVDDTKVLSTINDIAPVQQFKEIIYRAAYLDSNAKLQLIIQLENIE